MTIPTVVRPLKLIAIGNSQGVRLPQALLRRYGMAEQIVLEELPDGLMLRSTGSGKASLRQTFSEMAREQAAGVEDWSDLDGVVSDGIDGVKWQMPR